MMPRVAVQRIAFSNQYPTNIELPVYQENPVLDISKNNHQSVMDVLVYPNPSSGIVTIYLTKISDYKITLLDISGKQMLQSKIVSDMIKINTTDIPAGLYFIEVVDNKTAEKKISKLILVK